MGIMIHSRLADRVAAKNPQGELLSLVNGNETTEELKGLIIQLAQRCPAGKVHFQCPFHILSGLTHASIIRTVQALSRESCLQLFDMERECRTTYACECQSARNSPD